MSRRDASGQARPFLHDIDGHLAAGRVPLLLGERTRWPNALCDPATDQAADIWFALLSNSVQLVLYWLGSSEWSLRDTMIKLAAILVPLPSTTVKSGWQLAIVF